ncbi:MAG TPA: hypothetical protein VK849_14700 [Longimicrobiales bacterium]|nr:hypothetical protein [Longimicrobiales bacterium]
MPDVVAIEREWSSPSGFFFRLRQGQFDPQLFERALRSLQGLALASEEHSIDRRLVSLLWYIPGFMEWQEARVAERGGDVDAHRKATAAMRGQVERILGVP